MITPGIKSLQGDTLQRRRTGLIAQLLGSDVATAPGQADWPFNAGLGVNTHTVENWVNDGSNYVALAGTAGVNISLQALPKLHADQAYIQFLSAIFGGNAQSFTLGGSLSRSITVSRNATKIVDDAFRALQLSAGSTAMAGLTGSIFAIYDPDKPRADALTARIYNVAGALLETLSGYAVDTANLDGIGFNELQSGDVSASLFTEVTTFKIASAGLIFYDQLPPEADLSAGIAWMATNPTLGCYAPWK